MKTNAKFNHSVRLESYAQRNRLHLVPLVYNTFARHAAKMQPISWQRNKKGAQHTYNEHYTWPTVQYALRPRNKAENKPPQ